MFDQLFFHFTPLDTPITISYGWVHIFAAFIMLTFGCYTGLSLTQQARDVARASLRNIISTGGAITLGGSIWAAHATSLLGFHTSRPVSYEAYPLMISFILSLFLSFIFVSLQTGQLSRERKTFWGILIILILTTQSHFFTLASAQYQDEVFINIPLSALGLLAFVGLSGYALWVQTLLSQTSRRFHNLWQGVSLSCLFGSGIAIARQIGLMAVSFETMKAPVITIVPRHDGVTLAIIIILSIILGIALLIALYHKEEDVSPELIGYAFPQKLLMVALSLTLIAILWTGGNS